MSKKKATVLVALVLGVLLYWGAAYAVNTNKEGDCFMSSKAATVAHGMLIDKQYARVIVDKESSSMFVITNDSCDQYQFKDIDIEVGNIFGLIRSGPVRNGPR